MGIKIPQRVAKRIKKTPVGEVQPKERSPMTRKRANTEKSETGSVAAVKPKPPKPLTDEQKKRAWAIDQGLAVGARGRLSKAIEDQYAAAHKKKKH